MTDYPDLSQGRICRHCKQWHPFNKLKKHKEHPTGYDAFCLECHKEWQRQYRDKNRAEINARVRQDRIDNPEKYRERERKRDADPKRQEWERAYAKRYAAENRARLNMLAMEAYRRNPQKYYAHSKVWAAKNRDKVNATNRRYQKRHPENKAKQDRLYRLRHPEVKQIHEERRRARKRNLPRTMTKNDWRDCLAYWNNSCAICGRPAGLWHTLAADHWIPLSNPKCPGTVPENMLPLCHSQNVGEECCNNTKSKRDPIEWITQKLGAKKAKAKLREIETYFASVRK